MALTGVPAANPDEVRETETAFADAIAELIPEREAVIEKFQEIVDTYNDSWGWWRRSVFNRKEYEDQGKAIERIREQLEEPFDEQTGFSGQPILDVAEHIIARHHPVTALFFTSRSWVEDTMSPLSNVYGNTYTVQHRRDLDDWQDRVKDGYEDIVGQQKDSMDAAVDLASFMSRWLADIGTDNVSYIADLIGRLAEIAETLTSAITAIATSGGAFTLLEAARTVGRVVRHAITELGIIAQRIARAVERIIEAERVITDFRYFPDGAWPVAVTRP